MKYEEFKTNIREYLKNYKNQDSIPLEVIKALNVCECFTFITEDILPLFKGFHFHDDMYEILYMLEGNVSYAIEDKIYNIEKGDMVLICPNQLHQLVSPDYSKRIVCTFTKDFLDNFTTKNTDFKELFEIIKDSNNHKISFRDNDLTKIENLLLKMTKIIFSEKFGDDIQYNLSFCRMMLVIAEKVMADNELKEVSYITNPIIKKIVTVINNNLSNKISIDFIADELSLSSSYISHMFKQLTGISILQFIIKKRLIQSKELLRQGKRIEDIAFECGFQDYTSFFRSFKKEFGITPKKYVKEQLIMHNE
ncbi:MAG: AraC family transcriptional regulator [Bacilli bacterium]